MKYTKRKRRQITVKKSSNRKSKSENKSILKFFGLAVVSMLIVSGGFVFGTNADQFNFFNQNQDNLIDTTIPEIPEPEQEESEEVPLPPVRTITGGRSSGGGGNSQSDPTPGDGSSTQGESEQEETSEVEETGEQTTEEEIPVVPEKTLERTREECALILINERLGGGGKTEEEIIKEYPECNPDNFPPTPEPPAPIDYSTADCETVPQSEQDACNAQQDSEVKKRERKTSGSGLDETQKNDPKPTTPPGEKRDPKASNGEAGKLAPKTTTDVEKLEPKTSSEEAEKQAPKSTDIEAEKQAPKTPESQINKMPPRIQ